MENPSFCHHCCYRFVTKIEKIEKKIFLQNGSPSTGSGDLSVQTLQDCWITTTVQSVSSYQCSLRLDKNPRARSTSRGQTVVVTSALTSADDSLTSGTRSPDETDDAVPSVTHSIFVQFTSNFEHLHPLPPSENRSCHGFVLTLHPSGVR